MTIVEKRNGRREAPVSAETDERSLHREPHLTDPGGRRAVIDALIGRDGCECRYCGILLVWGVDPSLYPELARGTIDHLTPTVRGGTDDLGNLGLACGRCNSQKGARTEAEYLVWKALRSFEDDVERRITRRLSAFDELLNAWADAVGREIYRNAWPARIEPDGTVVVYTRNRIWAVELAKKGPSSCMTERLPGRPRLRFVSLGIAP